MNKYTKKDDMLRIRLLMLTILFPYACLAMELKPNNKNPIDPQMAKLAYKASRNLNLGHGLINLSSREDDPEIKKSQMSYAYKKFERANYCVDQIKERVNYPESRKE